MWSFSDLVSVVKADEIPDMKECGTPCGHDSVVAVHQCPVHHTHEAMLVCVDPGNAFVG